MDVVVVVAVVVVVVVAECMSVRGLVSVCVAVNV